MLILLAVALVALVSSAEPAVADTHTFAVLITISKTANHHVDWDVMGRDGKPLGSAAETANRSGLVWHWDFKFSRGTIRATWSFSRHGGTLSVFSAPITGGSGRYAGASGSTSAYGVTGSRLTKNLDASPFIDVVFHIK
jgi:hypothetical protein